MAAIYLPQDPMMLRWAIRSQAPVIFLAFKLDLPDLDTCHSNVEGFTS